MGTPHAAGAHHARGGLIVDREREIEATSKTVGRIAGDPITWAPFLPIAAAFAFLGTPWWICTAVGLGVAGGLTAWWRRQWKPLREAAFLESVKTHFATENSALTVRLDRSLAETALDKKLVPRLRQLVAHKTAIETEILEDGLLTGDEREIALMTGRLCSGIVAELETLAELPPGADRRDALIAEIHRGLKTVERTRQEIQTLLRPVPDAGPATSPALREHANELQARLDEASAIRRRLSEDLELGPAAEPSRQPENPLTQ